MNLQFLYFTFSKELILSLIKLLLNLISPFLEKRYFNNVNFLFFFFMKVGDITVISLFFFNNEYAVVKPEKPEPIIYINFFPQKLEFILEQNHSYKII